MLIIITIIHHYCHRNIFVRKDEVSYITYLNLGWEVIYLCKEIYVFHIYMYKNLDQIYKDCCFYIFTHSQLETFEGIWF